MRRISVAIRKVRVSWSIAIELFGLLGILALCYCFGFWFAFTIMFLLFFLSLFSYRRTRQ
jgi:hypothetical protein